MAEITIQFCAQTKRLEFSKATAPVIVGLRQSGKGNAIFLYSRR